MHHDHLTEIAHLYPIYARACDEKRFDLLARVFSADATLHYVVGEHEFKCTGADAAANFKQFLDRCYWTNHVIAAPMVEAVAGGARATARVVATHLQRLPEGTLTRWLVRGSYHDVLVHGAAGWRIAQRFCFCGDADGEFRAEGVEIYPTVAWATADQLG